MHSPTTHTSPEGRHALAAGTPLEDTRLSVRPMREPDLAEARRIFHLAFGTFIGLPDPMQFVPDRDFVATRWRTDPAGALAAEWDGQLVGSNLVSRWGSVGFFGPLTIRPDVWERGIARRLLEATMPLFERWQTRHVGLFTFSNSAKHLHLYQKFGFWPRFLTPIMSLAVRPELEAQGWAAYSALKPDEREEFLTASHELTDAIFGGLCVRREIRAVAEQQLGDTVLLWDDARLGGFAVCQHGLSTEGGVGTGYVKFAAARTAGDFDALLNACEAFASTRQLTRLEAGVNLARHEAYRRMIARGFRTDFIGVAMHRGNDAGYSRPDAFVVDDWR